MLTIFAVPKAFTGHIRVIQRNAIASWFRLRPSCEIILCGNETGTEETATEFNAKHMQNVDRNQYGTPLLNSVIGQVGRMARHNLICYVNADLMLLSDFLRAVMRIKFRKFLMVGQRWDVDIEKEWTFTDPDWEERVREFTSEHGTPHPPLGSDYFVFPREHPFGEIPPFAIGRLGWDNWFIYNARRLGIPVIDVSRVATVIHQNHDYGHVPEGTGVDYLGPESDRNRAILGSEDRAFTLLDATHIMTSKWILPTLGYKYLRRRWQTRPVLRQRTAIGV
jgi:hypothetical protein